MILLEGLVMFMSNVPVATFTLTPQPIEQTRENCRLKNHAGWDLCLGLNFNYNRQ